jgi:hypothetical protein
MVFRSRASSPYFSVPLHESGAPLPAFQDWTRVRITGIALAAFTFSVAIGTSAELAGPLLESRLPDVDPCDPPRTLGPLCVPSHSAASLRPSFASSSRW